MTVLAFLDAPTLCRRCGQPTITRKLGGRIPLHPACDQRFWTAEAEPDDVVTALTTLAAALGPLVVGAADPPVRPEEVGPCEHCRHPMRRYGPWARGSLCGRCTVAVPP